MPSSSRKSKVSVTPHTIAVAFRGHSGRLYVVLILALLWFGITVSLVENAMRAGEDAFGVSFKILAVGIWLVIQMARVLLGSFRLDGAWPVAKEFGWSVAVTNAIVSAISGSVEGTQIHFVAAEMSNGTPITSIWGADLFLSAVDGLPPFLQRLQVQRVMLIVALIRTIMCAIGWVENDV